MERRWRRKSRRYKGIGRFAWFRDPKRDILDLWISTTAPAQANELRGLVDWLVHDGDAAFFAFSLSLLPSSFNGLLLPYFPSILVILCLQRLFSFLLTFVCSWVFITVCCHLSLALQVWFIIGFSKFSRYLVRYTDCSSSLEPLYLFSYSLLSPSSSSSIFFLYSRKLVCSCVSCVLFSLIYHVFFSSLFVLDMLWRDATHLQAWEPINRLSCAWRWESLFRFCVYRYSSTTIRLILCLCQRMEPCELALWCPGKRCCHVSAWVMHGG